jgi:DNA-directed RNA polymerase subunit M/transcription elongation factor TFIIS
MSHNEINTKYNANWTFLDTLGMRLNIPHDWKQTLSGEINEDKTDLITYMKLKRYQTLKTKNLYKLLIEREHDCDSKTNAQIYWQNRYQLNDEKMKEFYLLPYIVTRSTTIQSMQFKILHKIINCNYWLNKIKIKDTSQCRFCNNIETIEHYFYACPITKQFWTALLGWWNVNTDTNITQLIEKDVILGYLYADGNNIALNCCILIGKSMIYKSKSNNKQPDIYSFHYDLKTYIEIERYVQTRDNKLDTLTDIWGQILEI